MRNPLLISALAFAALQAAPTPQVQNGVLRVTVRVQGTSEPVSGAEVSLSAQSTATPLVGQAPLFFTRRSAITDSNGSAVFDNLPPGAYMVSARRDGYIGNQPAFTSATIAPTSVTQGVQITNTQTVQEISMSLTRATSLHGRVRDAYGAPPINTRVSVGMLGFRDGLPAWIQGPGVQLDSRGEYHIGSIGAGEYYIRAETSLPLRAAAFYPGVAEIDQATRIPVQAGQEVVGIDFDIPNLTTFKVSGIVTNVPVRTLANGQTDNSVPMFTIVPADVAKPDTTSGALIPNARRGVNGEFEVNLPKGVWDLFPVISLMNPSPTALAPGSPRYATGRVRVVVTDRDVPGVSISVGSVEVKGRIVLSKDPQEKTATPTMPRVSLVPRQHTPSPLTLQIRTIQPPDSSGGFVFPAAPPGKYSLQLALPPAGYYVADVRLGAKSIYDEGTITVGSQPLDDLEIVIKRGGGSLRVELPQDLVTLPSGPLTPGGPRLALVPKPAQRNNLLLYKTAIPLAVRPGVGPTITGISPGEYKLFAWERLPAGGAEQNPEFIARYEEFGTPVTIANGELSTVTVRMIPADQ